MTTSPPIDPIEVLKTYFGFSSLREGQVHVIQSILEGKDALVVMPTGGGKSLCYQLPALCKEGVTLVISPLIALMKDQVDALNAKGISATVINSTLSNSEQYSRIQSMQAGEFKLVYIAPERFGHTAFLKALQHTHISLVAIDEAHCLSQWGHDFRPDYLKIGNMLDTIGHPQTIALTATATPIVRQDILNHLHLKTPDITVRGFSRDNLHFSVTKCDKQEEKYRCLLKTVQALKTGIIYCSTRKHVENVYNELKIHNINVTMYHAGLSDNERTEAQNKFIDRQSDVVVATNAFGMGIDRADVRFVTHFEIPGSIEAYYQEAGRAGRDGLPAYCELLFNHADLRTQEFFIEGTNPSFVFICELYEMLRQHRDAENNSISWTIDEMAEKLGRKNNMSVSSALIILIKAGYIERFDIPGKRSRGTKLLHPDISRHHLELDKQALEEKERRDRDKLEQMTRFAYAKECRQSWILRYFGEPVTHSCGLCDICSRQNSTLPEPLEFEEIQIIIKALSGIARASQRLTSNTWKARFGKRKIIAMLRGSKSKDLAQTSLRSLSTFGLLSSLSEDNLNKLFLAMEQAGLTQSEGTEYPLLTLSPQGHEVMMGRQDPLMHWPLKETSAVSSHRSKPSQNSTRQNIKKDFKISSFSTTTNNTKLSTRPIVTSHYGDPDIKLLRQLKALRTNISKEQGLPYYMIFTDETLNALAAVQPKTMDHALTLPGIGPVKASKYLPQFLETIKRKDTPRTKKTSEEP